ncbi:MAG TPA: hypothetical protein VHE35_18515 [Kofleriaceae bacterium]|nr:hypothetical protein [Kofleriaceae bacterium]
MRQCLTWIRVTAVLAVMSFSQPWSSHAAEAGPATHAAGAATATADAACNAALRGQLARAKAQLERLKDENRRLQRDLTAARDAERVRARKLSEQLGAPMIEVLQ